MEFKQWKSCECGLVAAAFRFCTDTWGHKTDRGETLQRGDIVFATPCRPPFFSVLRLPTRPFVHVMAATTAWRRGRVTSLSKTPMFSRMTAAAEMCVERKKQSGWQDCDCARSEVTALSAAAEPAGGKKKAGAGNLVRTGAPCQRRCCNFTLLCNRPTVPLGTTAFRRRGMGELVPSEVMARLDPGVWDDWPKFTLAWASRSPNHPFAVETSWSVTWSQSEGFNLLRSDCVTLTRSWQRLCDLWPLTGT